jgi:enamine deaminase RidA (YjgF/YER057c/UK114 family)
MRPLELTWDPGVMLPRVELVRTRGGYAALTRGRLIWAGAGPLDDAGEVVAVGDVAGQAVVAMDQLVATLQASGCELTDVVKVTVHVASADPLDLAAAGQVVRGRLAGHDPPGAMRGVTQLGHPAQLVEVEAIAVAP